MGLLDFFKKYNTSVKYDNDFFELIEGDRSYLRGNPYFFIVPYIMAKSLSSYEILTYKQGKEEKGENYFVWNIRPNRLESGQAFKQKIYYRLLLNGEVVIFRNNNSFYVLDEPIGLEYNPSTGYKANNLITLGNISFNNTLGYDKNLVVIKHDIEPIKKMRKYSDEVYQDLIGTLKDAEIKSLVDKYIFKVGATSGLSEDKQALLQKNMKRWLSAREAVVLPLPNIIDRNGQSGTGVELKESPLSKRTNFSTAQEIGRYLDEMKKIAFNAYNYPYTDAENEDVDKLRVKSLRPIAKLLEDELNYALYGKEVLRGSYVKIPILINNIKEQDQLIRAGINSINDARIELGKDIIKEDWADLHWITKNYQSIENLKE